MPAATETSPLLANRQQAAAAGADSNEAYERAAESAIESAIHGVDPNASAFQVPSAAHDIAEDDEEHAATAAPTPEGLVVSEEPPRKDLFLILAGMWCVHQAAHVTWRTLTFPPVDPHRVGTFLAALE